ncbi:PepSY domain-containing protein [Aliiroseovarius pelagivivens]|uniref:PepSY domain-containing protein n=1 Tax=Aliiroseovarius pelagivivens TaxID=1639690 RepID=UPI000D550366
MKEVLKKVQTKQPGKLLQVGFSDKGQRSTYRVLIVDQSGAVVSVTVDAGSGQITSMRKC